MKFLKNWKRAGALCIVCMVLFLHAGNTYLEAGDSGSGRSGSPESGLRIMEQGYKQQELEMESAKKQESEIGAEESEIRKATPEPEAGGTPESETETEESEKQESEPETKESEKQESEPETKESEKQESEPETKESEKQESEPETKESEKQEPETETYETQPPESEKGGNLQSEMQESEGSGTEKPQGGDHETQIPEGEESKPQQQESGLFPQDGESSSMQTEETDGLISGSTEETEISTEDELGAGEESETESETEAESEISLTEYWEDGEFYRVGADAGIRARALAENPVVRRDNDLIMTYLDYPCYFKYVTKHGMDVQGKTVAAYCVYNTLEAPEKENYRPSGKGAFSKEITYCLYNGCRYRGETAHKARYSTGNWKKDYYITQVAIHIINARQGRESSIESALNKSADAEIYKKIQRMVDDAYADKDLISGSTNQTKEVTFAVQPPSQSEWRKESDGAWRTAADYVCESTYAGRISSAGKTLWSGAPQGVSIVENEPGNPCSSFYFRATDAAYRKIMKERITIGADISVTTQEYGGWWYEPTKGSAKWQSITYLALEGLEKSKKPSVSATVPPSYFTVRLMKQETAAGTPLRGAIYGLYRDVSCTSLVAQFPPTSEGGETALEQLLCEQETYYIKEITPPGGYCIDSRVYPVSSSQREVQVELWDQIQKARIVLKKVDSETGKAVPQGDATLGGAKYGVYARENIVHPDGVTGVLLRKGEQAALLQTDKNGIATVDGLFPGQYYLKEITAPAGYVKDTKEHNVSLPYEGGAAAVISREVIVKEQIRKQPFQLKKYSDQGGLRSEPLAGAGFTAWLVSGLPQAGDGSYNTSGVAPVVIGAKGETELFTDEKGELCTIPLPYGTYLIRETTVPADHKPVADFQVTISEHSPDKPQPWITLADESLMARLKLIKKDADTARPILRAGAEFIVTDLETGERVEFAGVGPETDERVESAGQEPDLEDGVQSSFFTNEEGVLVLPQELPPGEYRIEEITAPEGYVRNPEPIDFAIHEGEAFQTDPQTGSLLVERECLNKAVTGKIEIRKYGELPQVFDEDFLYEKTLLSDVAFEITAAEDIVNSEHAVVFEEGTVVGELITDEKGYAVSQELPLGTYLVREKQAPFGFVTDQKGVEVKLFYRDQETPVVAVEIAYENVRQSLRVKVIKSDRESGELLAGAGFALYTKEPIVNAKQEVIVPVDTMVAQCMTDENGEGTFDVKLPHGLYYIREESAPEGYANEHEVREVDLRECDGVTEVIEKEFLFGNDSTQVEISKTDITDSAEISGASLEIRDELGNVVEQWTSAGQPHVIRGLEAGRTYTLTETQAPKGYVIAETVTFTVMDTGEVQKVHMEDSRAKGRLTLEKKDKKTGLALGGAVFELRTKDGELVETLTTDQNGTAQSDLLEAAVFETGSFQEEIVYILQEVTPPEGYLPDRGVYEITFPYVDGSTPVIEVRREIFNEEEPDETQTETESETETEKTTESETEHTTEPSTKPAQPSDTGRTPRTGDNTNILGAVAGLVIAAGMAVIALRFCRKI